MQNPQEKNTFSSHKCASGPAAQQEKLDSSCGAGLRGEKKSLSARQNILLDAQNTRRAEGAAQCFRMSAPQNRKIYEKNTKINSKKKTKKMQIVFRDFFLVTSAIFWRNFKSVS